jgi:hypothetical protein
LFYHPKSSLEGRWVLSQRYLPSWLKVSVRCLLSLGEVKL